MDIWSWYMHASASLAGGVGAIFLFVGLARIDRAEREEGDAKHAPWWAFGAAIIPMVFILPALLTMR